MMIFLILLLISVIHIVGYIRIKKTAIKTFLGIAGGIWMFFALICGWFVYETDYKIVNVDSSESPDGIHKLYFQQVGEPDWPFGYTHARLVLKTGERLSANTFFILQTMVQIRVRKTGRLHGDGIVFLQLFLEKSRGTGNLFYTLMGKKKNIS